MKRQTVEEYTREVVERRRMTEKKDRRCGNCERYICEKARQKAGECQVYTKTVTETEKPCTNWKEKNDREKALCL